MAYQLIVALHVIGATGALATGFLALLAFPNGSARHRILGKFYLACWVTLAISGLIVGMRRPGVSVFEVLTWLGMSCTLYAYSFVLRRKALGRTWLRHHYQWMLGSLTFIVVATINQLLPRIGIEYPMWVFYLMVAVPAPINIWATRAFDRRYGFAKPAAEVAQAAPPA